MFQMVETSRETYPRTSGTDVAPDGTIVFRDKVNKVTVIHNYSPRGGCLYGTGEVIVRNNRNGASFTYHTTTPPIDATTAAHMAWYRRREIAFTG